jgi:hypothetical protein
MVVVDQIEEAAVVVVVVVVVDLDVVLVVDHLAQENLIVHMMFVMNVEVSFYKNKNFNSKKNFNF